MAWRVVTMIGGLLEMLSRVELRLRLCSLTLVFLVMGSFLTVYVVVVTGTFGPRQLAAAEVELECRWWLWGCVVVVVSYRVGMTWISPP